MKIEFGAGDNAKEGYVSSDIRNLLGVTYVCACWDIHHHVETNSIEAIYSRHMFEHLTFAQGEKTLGVWRKILKKGGEVRMEVPDLHYHVKEYLEYFNNRDGNGTPSFRHAIASIYGWQQEANGLGSFTADKFLWDVHKSGYDIHSLESLAERCGYQNFKRNEGEPWNLNVTFYK